MRKRIRNTFENGRDPFLRLLHIRNIDRGSHEVSQLAMRISAAACSVGQPMHAPIRPDDTVISMMFSLLSQRTGTDPIDALAIIGMDSPQEALMGHVGIG